MKPKEIERRSYPVHEIRADAGSDPIISGYAAVFGEPSEDLGGFYEVIEPGAFAITLQSADVRALWNHNADFPLGRTRSGTLSLSEDKQGLAFEIRPPDTQYARDLLVSMKRGDVDQMSFGFQVVRDRWEQKGGQVVRTLLEVELYDVSPVTYPAYPQTSATVRSQLDSFTNHGQAVMDAASEKDSAQARRNIRKRKLQLTSLNCLKEN